MYVNNNIITCRNIYYSIFKLFVYMMCILTLRCLTIVHTSPPPPHPTPSQIKLGVKTCYQLFRHKNRVVKVFNNIFNIKSRDIFFFKFQLINLYQFIWNFDWMKCKHILHHSRHCLKLCPDCFVLQWKDNIL